MALNKTSKLFSFTLYHYPGKFDHVEKINYIICRLLAVQKPQIYFQTENRYLTMNISVIRAVAAYTMSRHGVHIGRLKKNVLLI